MAERRRVGAPVKKAAAAPASARATRGRADERESPGAGAPLVAAFIDDGGKVVIARVADSFGMSKSQLAETVGLNREALYKAARAGAVRTQSRVREMLENRRPGLRLGRRQGAGDGLVPGAAHSGLRRPDCRIARQVGPGRSGPRLPRPPRPRRLCLRFRGTCYRRTTRAGRSGRCPGDGAAIRGARFNPKGVPALCLSLDLVTAVKEANQGLAHKIEPCVLCSYDVDCEAIVDLRADAGRAEHGVVLDDLACAWFAYIAEGRPPPSWHVARWLLAAGQAGILVPGFAPGAAPGDQNLVLWTWSERLPHKVAVFDPSGRLPKDQLAWA